MKIEVSAYKLSKIALSDQVGSVDFSRGGQDVSYDINGDESYVSNNLPNLTYKKEFSTNNSGIIEYMNVIKDSQQLSGFNFTNSSLISVPDNTYHINGMKHTISTNSVPGYLEYDYTGKCASFKMIGKSLSFDFLKIESMDGTSVMNTYILDLKNNNVISSDAPVTIINGHIDCTIEVDSNRIRLTPMDTPVEQTTISNETIDIFNLSISTDSSIGYNETGTPLSATRYTTSETVSSEPSIKMTPTKSMIFDKDVFSGSDLRELQVSGSSDFPSGDSYTYINNTIDNIVKGINLGNLPPDKCETQILVKSDGHTEVMVNIGTIDGCKIESNAYCKINFLTENTFDSNCNSFLEKLSNSWYRLYLQTQSSGEVTVIPMINGTTISSNIGITLANCSSREGYSLVPHVTNNSSSILIDDIYKLSNNNSNSGKLTLDISDNIGSTTHLIKGRDTNTYLKVEFNDNTWNILDKDDNILYSSSGIIELEYNGKTIIINGNVFVLSYYIDMNSLELGSTSEFYIKKIEA